MTTQNSGQLGTLIKHSKVLQLDFNHLGQMFCSGVVTYVPIQFANKALNIFVQQKSHDFLDQSQIEKHSEMLSA